MTYHLYCIRGTIQRFELTGQQLKTSTLLRLLITVTDCYIHPPIWSSYLARHHLC